MHYLEPVKIIFKLRLCFWEKNSDEKQNTICSDDAGMGLNLLAKSYDLSSPDENIKVTIEIKEKIYYSVIWQNIRIIEPSPISLILDETGFRT